jgi:hypothetical protein
MRFDEHAGVRKKIDTGVTKKLDNYLLSICSEYIERKVNEYG